MSAEDRLETLPPRTAPIVLPVAVSVALLGAGANVVNLVPVRATGPVRAQGGDDCVARELLTEPRQRVSRAERRACGAPGTM